MGAPRLKCLMYEKSAVQVCGRSAGDSVQRGKVVLKAP